MILNLKSVSSSTLTQLHAKFPNITETAFSSIVPPAGRDVCHCQNYSFKNNETIGSFCKSKNVIFINNYGSFLTANGAPKKRFYGDFLSITKLSVLAKNIKWRRNSTSINSLSNPFPVNSIKLAKLAPSTSKPTNNSQISKELREAFIQLFTSLLDSYVS